MLFVANIGNTDIQIGVFRRDTLVCTARLSSTGNRSADEYAVVLRALLTMRGVEPERIRGAVLASVVKPLSPVLAGAVETLFGIRPLFMGPGVRTGLDIKIERPAELGADIAAACVGALARMQPPFVVVGLGDATTLTLIDRNARLCGVLICPGAFSGAISLSRLAAELPLISLEEPRGLLGRNTVDSMNNGAVYGTAAMVEGLVDRLRESIGEGQLPVIASGPLCGMILPHCRMQACEVPDLVLLGLKRVYELNSRR